jgi:AraC family transcriptional regulator, positive regulator of tynA and feaB
MRIRSLIKDRAADPDFGPPEAASEAGISLRYLQKLFTQRGSTCTDFVYSVRLNHAARLLDRREDDGQRSFAFKGRRPSSLIERRPF